MGEGTGYIIPRVIYNHRTGKRTRLCEAWTTSGRPCRNWAQANGLCYLHGGKKRIKRKKEHTDG